MTYHKRTKYNKFSESYKNSVCAMVGCSNFSIPQSVYCEECFNTIENHNKKVRDKEYLKRFKKDMKLKSIKKYQRGGERNEVEG